jgi:hypothetical protein
MLNYVEMELFKKFSLLRSLEQSGITVAYKTTGVERF